MIFPELRNEALYHGNHCLRTNGKPYLFSTSSIVLRLAEWNHIKKASSLPQALFILFLINEDFRQFYLKGKTMLSGA